MTQKNSGSKVTAESSEAINDFLRYVEPSRLKQQLIEVLLTYLTHECENLDKDFKQFSADLLFLFELLDRLDEERTEGS